MLKWERLLAKYFGPVSMNTHVVSLTSRNDVRYGNMIAELVNNPIEKNGVVPTDNDLEIYHPSLQPAVIPLRDPGQQGDDIVKNVV